MSSTSERATCPAHFLLFLLLHEFSIVLSRGRVSSLLVYTIPTSFIIGSWLRGLNRTHQLTLDTTQSSFWMYIPVITRSLARLLSNTDAVHYMNTALSRRDSTASTNMTIGIVVGCLVGLFILASAAFLYRYRYTVGFHKSKRRKHRHHRSKVYNMSSEEAVQSPPPQQPPPVPAEDAPA